MANTVEEVQEEQGVAYSYVRFSTSKQELGDSLRRQVEATEEYCAKHNLTLHPVSYRDLGVSAFKKKNLESGALAAFIDAVKTGKVAKGSYLIIEQFDRMSRADTDVALRLLLDLVHSGIKVVTLVDEKIWDKAAVKDIGNLILAIVFMSRANNESAMKADRISKAWGQKKLKAAQFDDSGENEGKRNIVTSECPRWLRVNANKDGFDVLPDKVRSVQLVFDSRIAGLGIVAITRRANEEKWPVPGKPPVRKAGEDDATFETRCAQEMTWHTSLVGRLLKNRALLGEYQPYKDGEDGERVPVGEPIKGYYPAVIDEVTFNRAAAKAIRDGRFPGRRDASLKNWLQGILKCTCGQSFVRKNKDSQAQPGYARYYCTARNRGVTKCPGANAKELEDAVLKVVSTVAPAYFEGTARMDELKVRADLLQVEVEAAKATRDRFVEAIAATKTPVPALATRVETAQAEVVRLEEQLRAVRAELADLAGNPDDVFENIVKAVKDIDSLDARAALREELHRVIEKAVVHEAEGYIAVYLRGSDVPINQPLRPTAALPGLTITPMTEAEYQAQLARE